MAASTLPAAGPRWRRALVTLTPVLLYLALAANYFHGALYWPSDDKWSVHVAASILHEGDTDLDEYRDLMPENDYTLEQVGGHVYTVYPIGASLLAVPFVAGCEGLYRALTDQDIASYLRTYGAGNLERLIASSLAALSIALLYLILRRHLPLWSALALSLGYGLATSAWSTAALALWQHTPTLLLLTLTLWALDAARDRPKRIQYAGLTVALALVSRPTNAIAVVLVTAYVALCYRRELWRYLAWAAPVAVAFIAYSLAIYGKILPRYYLMAAIGNTLDPWEGLAGTLVSPNRGLFIWSPIVLFALYGVYLHLRHHTFGRLEALLCGAVTLHWLLIASWVMWWGGYSMGPRFFTDILPYLAFLTIPVAQRLPQQRVAGQVLIGALFVASVAWGAMVQHRCATGRGAAEWGATPINVDIAPSRLWDWRDLQFLRTPGDDREVQNGLRVGWWRHFAFDDRIPGKGWSYPERSADGASFTWMAKRKATFYLEVRRPTDVAISFRVINWLTQTTLDSLQVQIGETPVALERTFDEHGAAVYTGVLPAEAFAAHQRYHVLTFAVDHALSPKVKDPQSTDPRKLALAFDWLDLAPLED